MDIRINIKNKIAELAEPARIVCGNSDYTAVFAFDKEWAQYQTKTARFYHGGSYTDVVFTGEMCPIPVMRGVTGVYVGVFAGDLHTSTPAYIGCEKSILCNGGSPAEPTPDVYAQILALLAEINKGGTTVTIDGEVLTSFAADTYTKALVSQLVDSAPETLDTLAEIAKALGNDPNFATTLMAELGKKANAVEVNEEFAKRNAVKGAGEYSLINSPDNIAQDKWAVALNKDTEAYGGGSFASGGGSVAGISLEKYKEIFADQLAGKSEAEIAELYAAALERSTVFDGTTYDTIGLKYWFAHAVGELAKAVGRASHAEGFGNYAENDFAHSEGSRNKSRGVASHTEGNGNEANAANAHAEGENNKANGANSHGEGYGNTVDAPNAHIEGRGNTIGEKAEGAHIEGGWNSSTGAYSHIEGQSNKASASFAHVEGINNEALHSRAHIEGQNNRSSAANQHVGGKYNADNANAIVIYGNGTSDTNRSNAYELLTNGNAYYGGNVYAGGERLAKVSEIGGSTTLYEHTVRIFKDTIASVYASFITNKSDPLDNIEKLITFYKEHGETAASGFVNNSGVHRYVVSHIKIYASSYIQLAGINIASSNWEEGGALLNNSATGWKVIDTVRALK